MRTNDPAFPLGDSCFDYANSNRAQANGMSLRDYFAAKAMQGMAAAGDTDTLEPAAIAKNAYQLADAMLAERAK